MGFIAPWVLALLPLVALPILIHLAARRRRVVIDFPAVQAFREEVATHAHRSRLRDLWLLLIRVLAVVALVLGLAQPVLWAEPESGPKGRGDAEDRTVWLAMDVSASQRYRDSKGEGPWDRAIGVARRLAALAGDARPVGVVEFDAVGVRRRLRPSSSSAEVYAALALLEPGWQPLSLSAVRGVLGENPGPWIDEHGGRTPAASDRATTVVISDLRGVGWRALGAGGATMEARGVVRLVQTAEGSVPNRGVVDIEASVDDLDAAGNHLRVNLAGEGRGRADVEVDGESAGSFEVRLTGDEPTGFDVSVPLTGGEVIRVALDADGFEADDVRYALVPRPRDLRIRVVVGEAMSRGASGRVVGQMLDPNGDGRWHRVVEDHGTLESALEDPPPDVVVLADLVSIDRFEAERLVGFARAGGGVLTVLGARADLRAWDLAGARELTGCRVLGFEDVLRSVGEFNAAHPLLGAFSTADLASLARVEIERMVRLDCDGETVLGGEEPLLALRHLGGGRVATLASALDLEWGELPLRAPTVPLLHRLVDWLAGESDAPSAVPVGRDYTWVDLGSGSEDMLLHGPQATTRRIPGGPRGVHLTGGDLAEPGVYRWERGDRAGAFSAQVSPDIVSLEQADGEAVARSVGAGMLLDWRATTDEILSGGARPLAKLFWLLAAALLALEGWVRRTAPPARARTGVDGGEERVLRGQGAMGRVGDS